MMSVGYGLGMLAIGMILILGAGIVLFLITNNKEEEK
jgi:hypothetical protein